MWRQGVFIRPRGLAAAALLSVVSVLGLAPLAHSTSAVTYEPVPTFCEPRTVVHDYLRPFKRMRKLHAPPSSGRVGFGPRGLRIRPFAFGHGNESGWITEQLVVGAGAVGYGLSLHRVQQRLRLNWDAVATLRRVDWRGRPLKIVARAQDRIHWLTSRRTASTKFELGKRPAPYRLTTVFRDRSGRKLGGYSFYFRVVAPTRGTRLGLNAGVFRSEHTVLARVENLGTKAVRYGARYAIEKLEGSTWVKAPESPLVFILPLYGAGPGITGSEGCSRFWIPPTMPPGRYRITKEVEYAIRKSLERPPTLLSAEFDVIP